MRGTSQPVSSGLAENPYPGIDGMTTWNASSALPPCAVGSLSGPITFSISTIEPGQPCVVISGSASSCGETHRLVGLGEWHGFQEHHDALGILFTDPRLPDVVDDILVEFGDAFYQPMMDKFMVRGLPSAGPGTAATTSAGQPRHSQSRSTRPGHPTGRRSTPPPPKTTPGGCTARRSAASPAGPSRRPPAAHRPASIPPAPASHRLRGPA